jgi:hypothetical protein
MPDISSVVRMRAAKLRNGRKVRKTIYAQLGDTPNDEDPLIGAVQTPGLAFLICDAVNEYLEQHPEAARILARAAWHSANCPD